MATAVQHIVLPTVKSEVDNRWTSQKVLMIGPPGIGKSEFFSLGEKTLYIQTEAGLNHLKVMKLKCLCWDDFVQIYTALLQSHQQGKFPYDTIVIDTCDKWVDFANEEVVERGRNKFKSADINVIGDIPNGAGWAWGTDLIENALGKLEQLPAMTVLIGHLDRKEIKLPNSTSVHLQTISIGGKTGRSLVAWCDHLMNIEAKFIGNEAVRVVRTRPSSIVEAKSRGGVVPDGWKWTGETSENYSKFRSYFTT